MSWRLGPDRHTHRSAPSASSAAVDRPVKQRQIIILCSILHTQLAYGSAKVRPVSGYTVVPRDSKTEIQDKGTHPARANWKSWPSFTLSTRHSSEARCTGALPPREGDR